MTESRIELSAHIALFHFVISEIRYAHMLEEVAGRSCTGKQGVNEASASTQPPIYKVGGRKGVILNGACLYLEGEISE